MIAKTIIQGLRLMCNVYAWLIIAAALCSYFKPDPTHPAVRLLFRLTDPVLVRARKILPRRNVRFDVSPIIVVLLLILIQHVLGKI